MGTQPAVSRLDYSSGQMSRFLPQMVRKRWGQGEKTPRH